MEFNRRSFIVLGIASGVRPAWTASSDAELAARRLVHVGSRLGSDTLGIGPLLVDAAAQAAARAVDSAGLSRVQADVQRVNRALQRAPTLEQVKSVLLTDEAMRLGISRAVDLAQQGGQLVAGMNRFVERVTPTRVSLAQAATRELSGLLLGPDGVRAARAYDTVGAVLGWAQSAVPPDLATLLPKKYAELGRDIDIALMGGKDVGQQVQAFGARLRNDAQDEVAKLRLTVKFPNTPEQLSRVASNERAPVDQSEGVSTLRAGASTLYSTLALLGANAEAQAVARVAGYVESAAKVVQTVQLLATAATGWGSVMAIGQLMGGAGGLGFFGGGGVEKGDAGQQAVLAALEGLRNDIKREFAQVNAKLDYVIGVLDEVVNTLARIDLTLAQLQGQVSRIDAKLDVLMQRQSQATLLLTRLAKDARHATCKTQLDNRDSKEIKECRAHYALVASQLSDNPWQLPISLPGDAYSILVATFPADLGSRTRARHAETWPAATALAEVLRKEYAVVVPGAPAYEPALWECLDSYAAWRLAMPEAFNALVDTREQVVKIRTAALNHETFVSALRLDRGGAAMDRVEAAYFAAANGLAQELRAAKEEVGRLADGTVGYFDPTTVKLTSQKPSASPEIPLFDASDFKPQGVSPLYNSIIDVPFKQAPSLRRPLQLEAIRYRTMKRTQVPGLQFWNDDAEIWVDVLFQGYYLGRHIVKLRLLFSRGKEAQGFFMQVPQDNPLLYLQLADDSSAVAAKMKASLSEFLRSAQPLAEVNALHRQVLENSEEFGQALFLRELALAKELGNTNGPSRNLPSLAKLEQLAVVLRALTELAYTEVSYESDVLQSCLYGGDAFRLVDTAVARAWAVAGPVPQPPELAALYGSLVNLDKTAMIRWVVFRNAWARLKPSVIARGAPFPLERAWTVFMQTFPEAQYPNI